SMVLALYAKPFTYETLPLVNVTTLFQAMPVPVPRLLEHEADQGVLAQQDLGDVTLQAHIGGVDSRERDAWYGRAAGILVTLQQRGRDLADAKYLPYS